MTGPDDLKPPAETDPGNIEAGALAAASDEDEDATDPLAPLNAVTEDDEE
jgi:hypothetical protein